MTGRDATRAIRALRAFRASAARTRARWRGRPSLHARASGDIRGASPEAFVRAAYQVVLGRDPDPGGLSHWTRQLTDGRATADAVVDGLLASAEFAALGRPRDHIGALHRSRIAWVRSLPPAARILDLGGASQGNPAGALVDIGWPYPFEQLVIVDLPSEERHTLFAGGPRPRHVASPLGPVEYRYHSMADLDGYDDGAFDMVFSGQSIEHVYESDADLLLKGAFRVLRPGGHLCLDTPNARVCRLHTGPALIHPDHKIEYTHEQLRDKVSSAGFELVEAQGLILLAASVRNGAFSEDEFLRNTGVFGKPEDCYVLAYVCRKPADARPAATRSRKRV
jgi:predicted SAM-dependent methyltransferase